MKPYTLHCGDCLSVLRSMEQGTVDCCVTSPPYFGLRDYGTAKWEGGDPGCDHREKEIRQRRNLAEAANACDGGSRTSEGRLDKDALWIPYKDKCGKCGAVRVDSQIGLEPTPDAYVAKLVSVFREVRRVLRDDGTLWLNLGDSYATGTKADRQQSTNPGVGANNPEAQNSVPRIGTPVGLKTKDLIGIPWRVAFALQADGWYLRQDIIWHKPNPMPESVRDRCTKAHEYVFLLSKSARYYFDSDAIKEPVASDTEARYERGRSGSHKYADGGPGNQTIAKSFGHMKRSGNKKKSWGVNETDDRNSGLGNVETQRGIPWEGSVRNKRSVWTVTTKPYKGAHFATYPPALIEPCILAGSREGGIVLDPFNGSGTTGEVSVLNGRKYVGIELNPEYIKLAVDRIDSAVQKADKLKQNVLFE